MVFKSSEEVTEVFDSLGTNVTYLKNNVSYKTLFEFNTTPVQTNNSSLCAHFCIYFIVNRLMNLDMEMKDVTNEIFVADCEKNEQVVSTFVKDLQ